MALAIGHRCSEIAAISRNSVVDNGTEFVMAVKPGFIYKNQRVGRCPPNMVIKSLPEDPMVCPVVALREYLVWRGESEGPLFINTKTRAKLTSGSISHILTRLINEADPGKIAKGHDVRKVASSLAWSRGVSPQEIVL